MKPSTMAVTTLVILAAACVAGSQAAVHVAADAASKERQAGVPALLQWLQRGGARLEQADSVSLMPVEGRGMAMIARKDFAQKGRIASVPRNLFLSSYDVDTEEPFASYLRENKDVGRAERLALLLIRELRRGKDSEWAPLIAVLPKQPDHILYWNDEQYDLLSGTFMHDRRESMLQWVSKSYERFRTDVWEVDPDATCGGRVPTMEEWKWAITTSYTRSIPLKMDGEVRDTIVPLLDMMNHRAAQPVDKEEDFVLPWRWNDTLGVINLVATYDTAAGEELTLPYPVECDADFLVTYGFVPEVNDRQCVLAELGIPDDDADLDAKLALMQGLPMMNPDVYTIWADQIDPMMIAHARLIVADAEQLESFNHIFDLIQEQIDRVAEQEPEREFHPLWESPRVLALTGDQPITLRNEMMMLEFMAKLMGELLARLPGSAEEDAAALAATPAVLARRVAALRLRSNTRSVLTQAQEMYRAAAQDLREHIAKSAKEMGVDEPAADEHDEL